MNISLNNNILNSIFNLNENKIKVSNIDYFQLDDGVTISKKEIDILPNSYKKNIENVFSSAVDQSQIKKEIKAKGINAISFKAQKGKIFCRLDGKSKEYRQIQNNKLEKNLSELSKKICKYLKNIGALKTTKLNISRADQKIIKTSPDNARIIAKDVKKQSRIRAFDKLSNVAIYVNKFFKTDSEWSLWAIWLSDIKSTVVKFLNVLGTDIYKLFLRLSIDLKNLPRIVQGWDDWLGYLLAGVGFYNGIQVLKDSIKIDDKEGKVDGANRIMRNMIAFIGGTLDWIGKALPLIGCFVAKILLELSSSVIFAFVAFYSTTRNLYLEYQAIKFKSKLNNYLKNDNLSEKQKRIATLKFLKRKLKVSKAKSYKIIKDIRVNNPSLSEDQVQKLAHEKIKNLVLTKFRRFERRVGAKIGAVIQDNAKEILKASETKLNIAKAKLIIDKVKAKNGIAIHNNKWLVAAAILQAISIILYATIGFSVPVLIPGMLCTLIFVILTGEGFYRKYYKKEDQDIKTDKLGKKNIFPILEAV